MTSCPPRPACGQPLSRLAALCALGALATASLTACGGDSPAPITGVFLDAPVQGLEYVAGTTAARTTNAAGEFSCLPGETVTFRIGGLALGAAPCGPLVTPLTLAGVGSAEHERVTNRLLALQLLDEDNDPSNGIVITPAVRTALVKATIDFSGGTTGFEAALKTVLATLPAPYQSRTVSAERRQMAAEHFQDSLAQIGQPVEVEVSQTTGAGTVTAAVTRMTLRADASLGVPYEGSQPATKADFPAGFLPAYGSGLAFKGKNADGLLEFYAITDRGPNGDGPLAPRPGTGVPAETKVFPAPSFTPSIGTITVGKKGAVLSNPLPLKASASQMITGLPIETGTGSPGELPLNDRYQSLGRFDANGLDTESLVLDRARNAFWISDEYGPFIVRVNASTGVIEKKYGPGTGANDLPAVLGQRRANRGMEGLTLADDGKLNGFLQSPIDPKDASGKSIKATPPGGKATDVRHLARFNRWIAFDPVTETSKLHAYPLDGSLWDKDRTGTVKLGDVAALGKGKFLVIEQGARKSDGKVQNWLMLVEVPANATDISTLNHNLEISSITGTPSNGADYSKVVPLKKTLLLDLNAAGWLPEKAEGLALVDERTVALVNDNDFGVGTVLLDANGQAVDGDITACTVDANGSFVSGCPAGVIRASITRGKDVERATRFWLVRFGKPLASYSVN